MSSRPATASPEGTEFDLLEGPAAEAVERRLRAMQQRSSWAREGWGASAEPSAACPTRCCTRLTGRSWSFRNRRPSERHVLAPGHGPRDALGYRSLVVATVGRPLRRPAPGRGPRRDLGPAVERATRWWLLAALGFEWRRTPATSCCSEACSSRGGVPLGWRASYDITMAGVAATRPLALAGLGGIALTGWALSRAGMPAAELARGLTTFYVALYGVFMLALVIVGGGLRSGPFRDRHRWA